MPGFATADARPLDGPKVAVVVPVYEESLDADQEISLRHLTHFLGRYDRYMVVPERLGLRLPGFGARRFGNEFFHGPAAYSAMLLSPEFYRAFRGYEYILIYQLDALVFSDQLTEWCGKGLDYVGAPWLPGEEGVGFVDVPAVGNGGFSLRRVESFLAVTTAPGFQAELDRYWDAMYAAQPMLVRYARLPQRIWRRLARRPDPAAANDPGALLNEDCFWSFRAVRYGNDFRIASVADALRFSFEVAPRRCFELNEQRLPFGCHAWNKYDREFWEPYLLG